MRAYWKRHEEGRWVCRRTANRLMLKVPSKTVKDLEYNVTVLGATSITCDCPGFQFRGSCKHVEQLQKQTECGWQSDKDFSGGECPNCGSRDDYEWVAGSEEEKVEKAQSPKATMAFKAGQESW